MQQQEAFSTTTAVEETVPPDMPTCTFPKNWTIDQWVQKKIDYPWLDARGGKLGCRVCEKVSLAVYKYQGVSFSVEWKNFQIFKFAQSLHLCARKSTDTRLHCHLTLQRKFMPNLTRKHSRIKWIA